MLAVKAVLALDDARMQRQTQSFRGPGKAVGDPQVRHRRILDRRVFQAGVLKADGAGGHHDVAGLDVQVDAAAGAGADEGVRAAFVQLLHGDSGGGAADARGAGGDLLPQKGARPDVVLPVAGHLLRVVKQGGNGGDPAGVAGQDAVPAHIAGGAVDVELLFQFLHSSHLIYSNF